MSALGDSFRTARESRGLSLVDAADRIHIRSIYLAAIEAEDWQTIGQPVYVRGFIRNYARFLGLDPDAAVAQYAGAPPATGALRPVTLAPSPVGEPSRSGLPRGTISRRRGPSVLAVLSVAVAVALVAFVGYQYVQFQQSGSPQPKPSSARRFADSARPAAAHAEPASRTQRSSPDFRAPAKNGTSSSGFAVVLKDNSWLRVVIDGKVVMEGLFSAGTSRSFSGRSVTVRVGNAGGVDVSVNGKKLGPLGGLGDVAERSFQL